MNVAEELIEFEDRIDREHVERRLADWQRRVADLYAAIEGWLPIDWTAQRRGNVPIHEELMQKFDVPEQMLPVLALEHAGAAHGQVEPRGLWIIGANGRLDLTVADRHYLIVDRSENFASPNWTIAPFAHRRQQRPLDRSSLVDALS